MKLVTHNLLSSNVRGVDVTSGAGYPLIIEAEEVREEEQEEAAEAEAEGVEKVRRMADKLDWGGLYAAAVHLNMADAVAEWAEAMQDAARSAELVNSEEFLRVAHRLLFGINVVEGALVCPATGRRFPIHGGIPNMMLHEDEL